MVDDYEPFLRFICSVLGDEAGLQIVGEVSDGWEAVRRAEQLKPDLILLDIGLPNLNGFEVARRVRELTPDAKIIFISQESCPEIIRAALDLGAWGYVVKAQAGVDLLRAVEAVLLGKRFISSPIE